MKVGLVINELDIKGGTHKQFVILANYLAVSGVEVTVFTKSFDPALYRLNERIAIVVVPIGNPTSKFSRLVCRIWSSLRIGILAARDSDIIHVHDNWVNYAIIFLGLKRKKVVWQVNDINPCFREGASKDTPWRFYFWYDKLINRLAARLVTRFTVNVSKNKVRVEKFLKKEAIVDVVYCGVELLHSSLQVKNNKPEIILFSLGVFFEYRNYETVIAVHRELLSRGYSVSTTIAGSQKLAPNYADKICDIANGVDGLNVVGQITDEELSYLFKESDFFLFLNVDQSWGLAVFESMNSGTPVILSNSVGAMEVLIDGQDVVLVNPFDVTFIADKVLEYKKDPTKYNNLRESSFKAVSKMTWDKMYCEKILAIFLEETKLS
jgi:glycosyltransferase involved in cell wall biosynthesis